MGSRFADENTLVVGIFVWRLDGSRWVIIPILERTDCAVVFVTHDIDKALYLSDRVLVLGGSPAGIVDEAVVNANRSRDRRDPELQVEARRLIGLLKY